MSFICWFRVVRSSSAFSGVFIAEDIDGVGDKRSGDTTAIDVDTHLEGFLNVSLKSACFTDEAFFLVPGLLSSSAGLSGFPNYQMSD